MQRFVANIAVLMLLLPGACAWAANPTTAPADVAIYPFSPIGVAGAPAWVPAAVQLNLVSDLGRVHLRPLPRTAGDDFQAALADARTANAAYLIVGTYQSADDSLRFTAQILDSQTGSIVGGLSVTGSLRDLFAMEDDLSDQAVHQLHQLMHPAAPPPPQPAPVAPVAAAPAPTVVVDSYNGSALQQFVNADRPPANDYWSQYNASLLRQMYYPGGNYYYPSYGTFFGGSYYYYTPGWPVLGRIGWGGPRYFR